MAQASHTTPLRVNEIDLLRFLAAMMVVFYHLAFRGFAADQMTVLEYPLLADVAKYGYLGVELFFIISGFVILMTVSKGNLKDFFISRAIRLYPAFWACCTLTFIATFLIGGERYKASIFQYLANMTMLNEFFGVPSIDGAYWSLFVELRFYALAAIVLLLRKVHKAEQLLRVWFFVTLALEFISIYKLRYLAIADYSVYFIAGAIYFLIWSRGFSKGRLSLILGCWGLALFQGINSTAKFKTSYGVDLNVYILCSIVSVFFVVMFLVSVRRTGFFQHKNWILLGVLTYPLYLLHQNIGFMIFNAMESSVNPHVLFWLTLLSFLVASYIIHMQIERRFTSRLRNRLEIVFDRRAHN